MRRLGLEAFKKKQKVGEGRDHYLATVHRPRTTDECLRTAEALEPRVRAILAALDDRGRWVEDGTIRAKTFNQNVETLAEYLAAVRGRNLIAYLPPLWSGSWVRPPTR